MGVIHIALVSKEQARDGARLVRNGKYGHRVYGTGGASPPRFIHSRKRVRRRLANASRIYAAALLVMALVFALFAVPRGWKGLQRAWDKCYGPCIETRVWRFGLYYFVLFGGFVALSQWLIPYYLNVYGMTLASAGLMATFFSLPSGLTRAAGGFLSDRVGARRTLYFVLSGVAVLFLLLVAPRMDITSPGEGVMADKAGSVTYVGMDRVEVAGVTYKLKSQAVSTSATDRSVIVWPKFNSWQEPAVSVGDQIKKKQILARGVTHVFFQANHGSSRVCSCSRAFSWDSGWLRSTNIFPSTSPMKSVW